MTLWLAAALLAATTAPAPPKAERGKESVAAIEAAYRCLATTKGEGVEACRSALALGPAFWRAEVLRQALAVKLVDLLRFEEAVAVYRESALALPTDAGAQLRFGSALLYFAADAAAAEAPLREALRLDPNSAAGQATLAMALISLGRLPEARAAFDEVLRLDPSYLDGRPGARQAYEAAQRGASWP